MSGCEPGIMPPGVELRSHSSFPRRNNILIGNLISLNTIPDGECDVLQARVSAPTTLPFTLPQTRLVSHYACRRRHRA